MVPLLSFFLLNLIPFATFFSRFSCLVIIVLPFFLLLLVSLFSFPLLSISELHLLSVPSIQFSSKSSNNDTIEYYIGLSDVS